MFRTAAMKNWRIAGWVWAPAAVAGFALGMAVRRPLSESPGATCDLPPPEAAVWFSAVLAREAAFEGWGQALTEAARAEVAETGDDSPFAVLTAAERIEGYLPDVIATGLPGLAAAIVERDGRTALEREARQEMFKALNAAHECHWCEALEVARAATSSPEVPADGIMARRALREAAVSCWPNLEGPVPH